MKRWLHRLFAEKSDVSALRVMAMISLIFGIIAALDGLPPEIVAIFVGAAFGGKVSQKMIEAKAEINKKM